MAALTATKVVGLDISAGTKKLKTFTVTPQANGDTVALATWFSSIDAVFAQIIAGGDAALTSVHPAFTTTTVTLTELNEAGAAATDWAGASISLWVIGEDSNLNV